MYEFVLRVCPRPLVSYRKGSSVVVVVVVDGVVVDGVLARGKKKRKANMMATKIVVNSTPEKK
tara:strand:+ start:646 stop:834 length:189 start_codon:yes stop_codon:yes gene_type:complete